jgi:hypothetical protein
MRDEAKELQANGDACLIDKQYADALGYYRRATPPACPDTCKHARAFVFVRFCAAAQVGVRACSWLYARVCARFSARVVCDGRGWFTQVL